VNADLKAAVKRKIAAPGAPATNVRGTSEAPHNLTPEIDDIQIAAIAICLSILTQ